MNDKKTSLGVVMITLGTIIGITSMTPILLLQQSVQGWVDPEIDPVRKAPLTISGNNIYVVWFNDKTPAGDGEVFFRVSTDAGKTFGEKINLSNTPNSDSVDVQLAEDEGKVAVSWWERNQTSNVPVMRVSTDNGKTFGETIMLSQNGTIG
jgi:hypothetical protein